MDKRKIASMIDHAVLKPEATEKDLQTECEIAVKYKVASVCVKPSHVAYATRLLKDSQVLVSTVIGFPHGSTTTACKAFEAKEAIENGAKELDMVINIGKLKSGDYDYVREDIKKVATVAHGSGIIVKAIIETALLTEDLIAVACRLSEEAGADYVKTSTGFNGRGASIRDIEIMKASVTQRVKIKASGGIKNLEQAIKFAQMGCSRLGTSGTASIVGRDINENSQKNDY